MSEEAPKITKRPSKPPPRTKSGQTQAVRAFREKLASIREGTFPVLEELNRQGEELREQYKSDAPKHPAPIPREDPEE